MARTETAAMHGWFPDPEGTGLLRMWDGHAWTRLTKYPGHDEEIHPALAWAHPLVQEWFTTKFGTPTEPQIEGWPAILRGEATLISAPTGSGKTLTAFLVCIDTLLRAALEGGLENRTHVVYISPLKALSNDIQKNLDGPLLEIQQLAQQRGYLCHIWQWE